MKTAIEIIGLLERAEIPNRDLDAAIAVASGILPVINVSWTGGPVRFLDPAKWVTEPNGYLKHPDYEYACRSKEFTGSIDCARMLIPEGAHWIIQDMGVGFEAFIYLKLPDSPSFIGRAKFPAIAICIAAMKAAA